MKALDERIRSRIESSLPAFLQKCRWFGGKSRQIKAVRIDEAISLASGKNCYLAMFTVEYAQDADETYQLPLMFMEEKKAASIRKQTPDSILFSFTPKNSKSKWIAFDAIADKNFRATLFETILNSQKISGRYGEITPSITSSFRRIPPNIRRSARESKIIKGEQSNTSIAYGKHFILKLVRRLEEGGNPDVEIGRFITDFTDFTHTPQAVGALEYLQEDHEPTTLGGLHTFVANKGDAWKIFMAMLNKHCRGILRKQSRATPPALPSGSALDLSRQAIPANITKTLGQFLRLSELLGLRTMEMHLALATETDDQKFKAEPFTLSYQHDVFQLLKKQAESTFTLLRNTEHWRLVASEKKIINLFERLLKNEIQALRTRTHGDYHLGQVLFTGKDFIIIDFEGEPARSLAERKLKRSPLRDVAGMLRSFHYASHVAMTEFKESEAAILAPWMAHWHAWVCAAYLKGYFSKATQASFLPQGPQADSNTRLLLDIYLMEKALYELVYEINNRPNWVKVPLSGLLDLLEAKS